MSGEGNIVDVVLTVTDVATHIIDCRYEENDFPPHKCQWTETSIEIIIGVIRHLTAIVEVKRNELKMEQGQCEECLVACLANSLEHVEI